MAWPATRFPAMLTLPAIFPKEYFIRRYGEGPLRPIARKLNPLGVIEWPPIILDDESFEEWRLEMETEKRDAVWDKRKESKDEAAITSHALHPLGSDEESLEVVLADQGSSYSIPRVLLSASSKFFEDALHNLTDLEEEEGKIVLNGADSKGFELFVNFLYWGPFELFESDLYSVCQAVHEGDRLGATDFRNFALDRLYTMNERRCAFTPQSAMWVHSFALPASPLRELMLDTVARCMANNTLTVSSQEWAMMTPIHGELLERIRSTTTPKLRAEYGEEIF